MHTRQLCKIPYGSKIRKQTPYVGKNETSTSNMNTLYALTAIVNKSGNQIQESRQTNLKVWIFLLRKIHSKTILKPVSNNPKDLALEVLFLFQLIASEGFLLVG
ncbi:hypothetical protein P8452_50817 [Trifolium repens]|nr:hypothetical protein P8452_50817 [Trifolium repens]